MRIASHRLNAIPRSALTAREGGINDNFVCNKENSIAGWSKPPLQDCHLYTARLYHCQIARRGVSKGGVTKQSCDLHWCSARTLTIRVGSRPPCISTKHNSRGRSPLLALQLRSLQMTGDVRSEAYFMSRTCGLSGSQSLRYLIQLPFVERTPHCQAWRQI